MALGYQTEDLRLSPFLAAWRKVIGDDPKGPQAVAARRRAEAAGEREAEDET